MPLASLARIVAVLTLVAIGTALPVATLLFVTLAGSTPAQLSGRVRRGMA